MSASRPSFSAPTAAVAMLALATTAPVRAQIATDLVDRNRANFRRQATDADMKREGGTQPRDWEYDLPAGVITRQITFYVDGGTPLYGKIFFPKDFRATDHRPGVVVGHGINALSIGIEKYAARFADRGLVAMAIDYQSYGFSGSGSDDLRLLEADPSTDAVPVLEKRLRVVVKRTNLNNAHEVDDYRAAISYLQGEPGIDPDRIGIWGSSNAGSVVIAVAEIDARAKAVVAQVAGPRPIPRGPSPLPTGPQAAMVDDAIARARTGQGAEVDGGFSFRSKIDLFGNFRNRDVRPGAALDQIAPTTKILFLPAEKDELTAGPGGALEATKYLNARGITSQTIVFPELTHFQAYSNTGFEVGATLAAEWFLKYLAAPDRASLAADAQASSAPAVSGISRTASSVVSGFSRTPSSRGGANMAAPPSGVVSKDVVFFSEAVQCRATIFLPKGVGADRKAPAVVLAPAPGDTAASIAPYAAQLASRGVVAMAIDYRGWGKSGGFLYLGEPIRWDDRLRFSQHTAKVRIRRKRSIPEAQIQDIRNAISFLQGEPGVDRNRIGVWGVDASGGHVVAVSAVDIRVKAAVVQTPIIPGRDLPRRAATPSKVSQAEMISLARNGPAPGTITAAAAMNEREAWLAFSEYRPFWSVDQIPPSTAVLFITAEKDTAVDNEANAVAASKLVKGPNGVTVIPEAGHAFAAPTALTAAIDAAAAWFQKYLQ